MKITYIHQYFNTNNMSGGSRSYNFGKYLVKKGHEVNMITSWTKKDNYNHKGWFKTNEDGIKVNWIPVIYSNYLGFWQRIKAFIKFAWYSTKKATEIKTDLIVASSTPLTVVIPAIIASKINKVPMVFEVRDLWPDVPIALNVLKNPILKLLAKFLEYLAYKNSISIIVLSPTMKLNIIKKKIISKKIAVIPNSSDLINLAYSSKLEKKFIRERSWINYSPFLIYTGTFGKVNNLSYAISLSKALKDINSKVKILLIGDGIEKNNLIIRAKKENLYEKNIFFEDKISRNKLQECLSAATMCSNLVVDVEETWANSANKFFDCLAAGKPIFLNHGGWMSELVSCYECGFNAYGMPIEVVAKELDEKMFNTNWLKKRGEAAKKLAKKYFEREDLAFQFEKVLLLAREKNNNVELIAPGEYYKLNHK